ncbi:MAG: hypothetical protein EOM59_17235 [Clostridia bacterium]|nr:hypothetical protein [Clostridia bacterium]
MSKWLRNNIGSISAALGFAILVILTFGDIGEVFSKQYWINVLNNIGAISALAVGIMLVQYQIKQGISEQALATGLNTAKTKDKYEEHDNLIKSTRDKHKYMPYFLDEYNNRETKRRKREFLVDNGFKSENDLNLKENKKLKKKFASIRTKIVASRIKWSSADILYKADGTIETLGEYRTRRALYGILQSAIFMIGTTLITYGMFSGETIPIWQKLAKIGTYVASIAISVIFPVIKNYEKGAFGVPNELEEVNGIWREFEKWVVPQWVINEMEVKHGNKADVQEQQAKKQVIQDTIQI